MAVNVYLLLLMPISQVVSWYYILSTSKNSSEFYVSICFISLFYCIWAVYNRYVVGVTKELGHYTMGFVTMASYSENFILSMMACTLVLLNFVLVAIYIIFPMNVHELAQAFKNETSTSAITWAYTFKWYFISNMALWSTILYLLYKGEYP